MPRILFVGKYADEFVSIKTKLDRLTAEDSIATGFASAVKVSELPLRSCRLVALVGIGMEANIRNG